MQVWEKITEVCRSLLLMNFENKGMVFIRPSTCYLFTGDCLATIHEGIEAEANLLMQQVQALRRLDVVDIKLTSSQLILRGSTGTVNLVLQQHQELPPMRPRGNSEGFINVNADELARVSAPAVDVCRNASPRGLQNVQLAIDDSGSACLVRASDSFSVYQGVCPGTVVQKTQARCLIWPNLLWSVLRTFKDNSVALCWNESRLWIWDEYVEFDLPLVQAQFPNLDAIISGEHVLITDSLDVPAFKEALMIILELFEMGYVRIYTENSDLFLSAESEAGYSCFKIGSGTSHDGTWKTNISLLRVAGQFDLCAKLSTNSAHSRLIWTGTNGVYHIGTSV